MGRSLIVCETPIASIASVHLESGADKETARLEQLKVSLDLLNRAYSDQPVLLMGDFNFDNVQHPLMWSIVEEMGWEDAYRGNESSMCKKKSYTTGWRPDKILIPKQSVNSKRAACAESEVHIIGRFPVKPFLHEKAEFLEKTE